MLLVSQNPVTASSITSVCVGIAYQSLAMSTHQLCRTQSLQIVHGTSGCIFKMSRGIYHQKWHIYEKTVDLLHTVFCPTGLPEQLVSDNGLQFPSAEYQSFVKEYGIKAVFFFLISCHNTSFLSSLLFVFLFDCVSLVCSH